MRCLKANIWRAGGGWRHVWPAVQSPEGRESEREMLLMSLMNQDISGTLLCWECEGGLQVRQDKSNFAFFSAELHLMHTLDTLQSNWNFEFEHEGKTQSYNTVLTIMTTFYKIPSAAPGSTPFCPQFLQSNVLRTDTSHQWN